jgi:hypothetical protein
MSDLSDLGRLHCFLARRCQTRWRSTQPTTSTPSKVGPNNDGSGSFHDCTPAQSADDQRTMAGMFCGEVFANQIDKGVWNAVTSLTDLGYTATGASHIIVYAVNTERPGAKAMVGQTILGTTWSPTTTTTSVPLCTSPDATQVCTRASSGNPPASS